MLTIFDSAAPVKSDRPFGPAVDDMDDAAMFDDHERTPTGTRSLPSVPGKTPTKPVGSHRRKSIGACSAERHRMT